MEQLDARGQACPLPVVRAKKALAEIDEGQIEVQVDNKTAVHNLENLGKSLKCETESKENGENDYSVIFTKTADSEVSVNADMEFTPTGDKVVVLKSEFMGTGDDELGAVLMKAFTFALTQQDELPQVILAYNGGVKLTVEGSPVLDDLKTLAENGVQIFSCGTCLNHYGLTEKLAVGEVTNMYVIAQKQLEARVVVQP